MARDLFGGRVGAVARAPSQGWTHGADRSPRKLELIPHQPPGRRQFYPYRGRTFSYAELLAAVNFSTAANENPNDDVIVVLESLGSFERLYLVALPRDHPSRFNAQGKRDPALAPFWGHGDVLYIRGEPVAPP
jgi:hypothetical protein